MASLDIGIDLGTCTVLAGNTGRGVLINEPSVVAFDKRSNSFIAIGSEVYKMIGRTPGYIEIIRPLDAGVISNFKITGMLIRHVLRKMSKNHIIKPRVIICVPSVVTGLEAQSVMEAAVEAGARQVYLLEEPVAAAIGAGIDITKPVGNMILDIGGGISDAAVLSLRGVVCKSSVKVAGRSFDDAIIRHMRSAYGLVIGEKTAEEAKIRIGGISMDEGNPSMEIKGRDIISGLPSKVTVYREELVPSLREVADQILVIAQNILERTPPELASDIRENGIIMTGGGSLLSGLSRFISNGTKVEAKVADNSPECVVTGTIRGFKYIGELYGGFLELSSHTH